MIRRLALFLLMFSLTVSNVAGLLYVEDSPEGTYSFEKDGEGDLLRWHVVSDEEDFRSWTITAFRIIPAFGICDLDTEPGFLSSILLDNTDVDAELTDDVEVMIHADELFAGEITMLEEKNAWNGSNAYSDGDYSYVCYQVQGSFKEKFLERTTPYFLVKIYSGKVPPSMSFLSSSMVFIILFMVAVLAYVTLRPNKRK